MTIPSPGTMIQSICTMVGSDWVISSGILHSRSVIGQLLSQTLPVTDPFLETMICLEFLKTSFAIKM